MFTYMTLYMYKNIVHDCTLPRAPSRVDDNMHGKYYLCRSFEQRNIDYIVIICQGEQHSMHVQYFADTY